MAKEMSERYPISATHRDFWHEHIMIQGSRIIVIDFGRCLEGPFGRDAAQFWLRLGDLAALNPFVSRGRVRELQQHFLRGCNKFEPAKPHVKVFSILCRLEQICGLIAKDYNGPIAYYQSRLHALTHLHDIRRQLREVS